MSIYWVRYVDFEKYAEWTPVIVSGDMANEFNGICWVKSYHDNPEDLYNTHLNVYCNYDGSYQYLEFENIYVNENSLSINLPQ